MSLTVVMPSRGRPERARIAVQAIRDTAVLVDTEVVLVVDADDPTLPAYKALHFRPFGAAVNVVTLSGTDTGNLVRATNTVSMRIAEVDPTGIIGNLGDDHLCLTPGWDKHITRTLSTPGIAYGDDLLQGEHLPTAPFVSSEIVLGLGWFFLPTVQHLYGDDCLKRLGRATGTLRYVPEVITEHVHPATGKVPWDEGYKKANSARAMARDLKAYSQWLHSEQYNQDVATVRRISRVAA